MKSDCAKDWADSAWIERTRFELRAEQWIAFVAALEGPVRPHGRLKRLMTEASVFERDQR